DASRSQSYFRGVHVQPLLGCAKPLQAGNLGVQVDVLPLGVESGCLQLVDAAEEMVDKTRHAPIPVRVVAPVVGGENGRYGDSFDPFAICEEVWIVRRVDGGGKIVVLKFRVVTNGQEFESRIPSAPQECVDWLRGDEYHASHLAAPLHLLQRHRMRDEGFLHLEPHAAKD